MATIKPSAHKERELAEFIAGFYDDPYGFVMAVFPWGCAHLPDGSFNPLHNKYGPEDWQREELEALGKHIKDNMIRVELGLDMEVYRLAVASGHGIGKSAFVSWIIHFLMSTRVDTRMAVTASTQFQLEDKTWPELGKWKDLAINGHWFEWTATGYSFASYPDDKKKNYKATAATVSETNTEAFAGMHNEGKTVAVIFDEASGVFPKIWEVADGALTDGEAFFFGFGNPTKPDGEFADCFDKNKDLYRTRHVDSREVSFTNKNALRDIINKYGAESDEAKVRVYGQFPATSYNGFFLSDAITHAMERDLVVDRHAGLVMGIDVARMGGDSSVFCFRQGRDARSIPSVKFTGLTFPQLADKAAAEINAKRPDIVAVESTGMGIGFIDIMRDRGFKIVEVHMGATPDRPMEFVSRRAELYSICREWVYGEGCLPDDPILKDQMSVLQYGYDRHEQRLRLETKDEMKKRLNLGVARGWTSPDDLDSLVLTFAVRAPRRDRNNTHRVRQQALHEEELI